MKINWVATGAGAFFSVTSFQMMGVGSSRVKDCDRDCLVGFVDGSKVEPTQSGFTSPIP